MEKLQDIINEYESRLFTSDVEKLEALDDTITRIEKCFAASAAQQLLSTLAMRYYTSIAQRLKGV